MHVSVLCHDRSACFCQSNSLYCAASGKRDVQEVVLQLQGPTVLSKGPVDAIANVSCASTCETPSCEKRCVGQGDLLAGLIAGILATINSCQVCACQCYGQLAAELHAPGVLCCH